MRKVQAGTLESSDCMVIVEEKENFPPEEGLLKEGEEGIDLGRGVFLTVSGAGRFRTSVAASVKTEAEKFGISDVRIFVQGSALDVVLSARLETAFTRYRRT
ncbi:MAG: citrate lyase acyl carrier protein [Synergistaceae bacterium]|jgi:citrate lyase gamma subunit|nr:citrate lyase acyl carrier protein [Synergistaceae bacterium]